MSLSHLNFFLCILAEFKYFTKHFVSNFLKLTYPKLLKLYIAGINILMKFYYFNELISNIFSCDLLVDWYSLDIQKNTFTLGHICDMFSCHYNI